MRRRTPPLPVAPARGRGSVVGSRRSGAMFFLVMCMSPISGTNVFMGSRPSVRGEPEDAGIRRPARTVSTNGCCVWRRQACRADEQRGVVALRGDER